MMLPPENRMRSRIDFEETVRAGRRVGRGCLVTHLLLGGPGSSKKRAVAEPLVPRIGLIVGKQVGGSVARKRVSRRLRVALGRLLSDFPESSRVVVRALPGSATAATVEFELQLRSAVHKLLCAAQDTKGRQ